MTSGNINISAGADSSDLFVNKNKINKMLKKKEEDFNI